jgi:hypothetical protein
MHGCAGQGSVWKKDKEGKLKMNNGAGGKKKGEEDEEGRATKTTVKVKCSVSFISATRNRTLTSSQ